MRKLTKMLTTAALIAAAGSAASASTCADRNHVVQQLNQRFGETLYGNALSRDNAVLEIYSNNTHTSWTILVTLPERGLSCLVASGNGERSLSAHLSNLSS